MSGLLKLFAAPLAALALLITAQPSLADNHGGAMKELANTKVKAWIADPAIISAIKAQNEANAGLTEDAIIKLDKQWRAETKAGSGPLVDKVLNNALSGFLKKVKEDAGGLYTEIFVMDNKGLNVGQSDVTSDYWQGDEAKWQKTYPAGPGAVHIGKVAQDESTQKFQSQLSLPITDPATGKNIGAVTIGVDLEALGI
jgi:hypothetical protein